MGRGHSSSPRRPRKRLHHQLHQQNRRPGETDYRQRTPVHELTFQGHGKATGIHHTVTTAYHSQANGIVERFHRTLKAAIMAKQHCSWSESLPLIWLSLRALVEPDIKTSPAELVYGATLSLPGDMVATSSQEDEFAKNFICSMQERPPTTTSQHGQPNFYVTPALRDAAIVFIRDDTVRPSLSIDRFKPAFVADEDLVSTPVLVTCSYPIIPAVRPPAWALPIAHSSAEAGHRATARTPTVATSATIAQRAEGAQPVRRSSITTPPCPSPI